MPGPAKSISIKGPGCRSGGCAVKAVSLTSGGLRRVPSGLRESKGALIAAQKSAEGIVGGRGSTARSPKARTVGVASRMRAS